MLHTAAREAGDKLGVEPGVSKLDSDSAADLEPFFADERAEGHLDEDAEGPEQPKAKLAPLAAGPRSLTGSVSSDGHVVGDVGRAAWQHDVEPEVDDRVPARLRGRCGQRLRGAATPRRRARAARAARA